MGWPLFLVEILKVQGEVEVLLWLKRTRRQLCQLCCVINSLRSMQRRITWVHQIRPKVR